MGVGRRRLAPLWALALALACTQHTGLAQDSAPKSSNKHHPAPSPQNRHSGDRLLGVTVIPPLGTVPVIQAQNPAHNGRVCSTWGDFHYKTFDGDIFRFPGLCNYVFSAHCGAAYEDFNIQLRRGQESNATVLSRVVMKLDGLVIELNKSSVLVNGRPVQLPFSQSGVLMEYSSGYLKVVARLGLVLMWNRDDDSLLLELDTKYANKTCGLCGDFNGIPVFDEFLSHNIRLTPVEFGNLQKMDGPTEQCQDPAPEPPRNCSTGLGICEELLGGQLFSGCAALVDVSSYVEACRQDLCRCGQADAPSCACHTLAEYSRQCAHAGGLPPNWRSPDLCPRACPLNLRHQECSSPCTDTCSNPQRSRLCEDHCTDGCFCPEGTVLDDIGHTGCVPVSRCSCVYNGTSYAPGASYSTDCTTCTCSGGRWSCQAAPCPGTCSLLGGAHVSTFDEKWYTAHGDCSYVLTKPCHDSAFTVLAELRRCGLTDSETCLKSVTLSLGGTQTVIVVKATGEVFVNQIYTQLPVSAGNVTLFRPSTFFIMAQTTLGLQLDIQLVPTMQVFVQLAPEFRGLTCGLCGNFNSIQADDFRTNSGVVEGTAAAFVNTFKTQASCPNIKNSYEDPCSLSVENEKFAQHWCSRLTDDQGPFAQCHTAVSPATYYSNCMFDTCNCEKSEDCLCAALSAYVHACAAKGVLLRGWRDGVCAKPTTSCPKTMTYHYHISTCQPTCRSLSQQDVTCHLGFVPVDGCACPNGTFLDDSGKCVQATSCPCYHRGSAIPNGESVHDSGAVCTCTQGTLTCIGGQAPTPVCVAPMVYFDCRNATPGAAGAGCQKSCHTLDMACYSTQCVPGCVCPDGLVADGEGGCVALEDCPCVHNEASYRRGETIRVDCNTCTCEDRMWRCTEEPCLATCAVYGDGHFLTFDGQRYSFSGDCQYTLAQDNCAGNGSTQDGFRVITENVPCGTTGTTCSKDIKIFLGSFELKLVDGKVEVVQRGTGQEPPYTIRQMGIYLVVDTDVGLVLLWDQRTSIFLMLSPEFKGKVCGLCGNFDDNALNDFTTRSQAVVGNALEFANSWKFSPTCPDALVIEDPCTANPYRKAWAQRQCSIINSAVFDACHAHVEPTKYYEACVGDACACDSGGDCECFCTAVAAYAQACHDAGVCVSWRTPDICPLFCDYYNTKGQCEWHYQPCGAPCMRTCRNPSGRCQHDVRGLEGCYPKCPPEAPIFDEDKMLCVDKCPAPTPAPPCRVRGMSYWPGAKVPSEESCHSCVCTESGVRCIYDADACVCIYDGRTFHPGDLIYHTADGTGGCISAHCRANGTVERKVYACSPTSPTPTTTFSFFTSPVVVSSTQPPSTVPGPSQSTAPPASPSTAASTATTTSSRKTPATASVQPDGDCGEECRWSHWLDVSHPGRGVDSGDFDTLENLRAHGYRVCLEPREVECRAEDAPQAPLRTLGQRVECSRTGGLTCYNRDQASGLCRNYQIRVLCCSPVTCPTSSYPATSRKSQTGATASEGPSTASPASEGPSTASPASEGPSTASPAPVTTTGPATVPTAISMQATVSVTPASGSSTPVDTSLLTSGPTPATTTATSSMSTSGSSAVTGELTSPETYPVTCLKELCTWTPWLDGSYPGPGRNSGDFDTFQNLRSKGFKFCKSPTSVECRAQFFPNTPLAELGQDVTCNAQEGLICLNKDQLPPICYNYEIRIQCCEVVDRCRGTPTVPPASAATHYTTRTHPTTGTHSPSTQPTAVHTATVSTASTSTVSLPVTTECQPQCNWTKWLDVDFPVPGPHGGDMETYSNILSKGERICHGLGEIAGLECRAENHPDVSIESLGQVVRCDPEVGLVCRNRDQKGGLGMCLNYELRALCCHTPKSCISQLPAMPSSTPRHNETSRASPSTPRPSESSPAFVHTTSSASVPTASTNSVHTASSAPVHTASLSPVYTASTTSVHTASSASVHTASSGPVHTASSTSVHTVSSTSAPTASSASVHIASLGPVHTASSTSVHTASSGPVHTASTTSVNTASSGPVHTASSTSVHTASPAPVHTASSASGHTASSTSVNTGSSAPVHTASTTSVHTASSTSGPTASSAPVHTASSTSVHTASTAPVHTASTTSVSTASSAPVHTGSTAPVHTASSASEPTASSAPVHTASSASLHTASSGPVQTASSVPVHTASTTSVSTASSALVHTASSASVHTASSGPVQTASTAPVHTASTTSVHTTSSAPVHRASSAFVHSASSAPVHTASTTSAHTASSTSVHTASTAPVHTASSASLHTASTTSVNTASSASVSTASPAPVHTASTTSVHTASSGPVQTASSTSVHTASSGPVQTASSAPVHTASTTSVHTVSTTSVHTASSTSGPTASSASVHTASLTSGPTASSTSVHTASSTSVHTVSSASVHTPSSAPVHTASTTSVNTASSAPVHTASSASVHTASSAPVHTASSAPVHTASTTSVNTASSAPVHTASTTSVHTASTAPVHTASSAPVHTASTTSVHTASTAPVHTASTAPVHTASSAPVHTASSAPVHTASTTPVHTASSAPVHTASSAPVHTASTTSVNTASSAPVHTGSTAPVHTASSAPVQTASTTSVHTASTAPVHTASSAPVHTASTTSVHTASTAPVHTASTAPVHTASTTSVYTASTAPVHTASSAPVHTASTTSMHTTSSSPVYTASSVPVHTASTISGHTASTGPVHTASTTSMNTASSSAAPSTSAVSSEWPSSSAVQPTTTCFCNVLDKLFPAGSIIYRQVDLSGHCFYALCNQDCHVVRGVDQACPSTTPPTTPASSLWTPTPKHGAKHGCPNVLPPREKDETWPMPNCSQATCKGQGIVSVHQRPCPELTPPTCANGYPALKVADQDSCCQHYQCQCVCSGWGDPHYITFDGTYYTFLDNCTYVLVQQIVPVYGHFRVLVDNYFCDLEDGLSCPQSIIVEYHQDRVVLTRRPVDGVMTNQILFNGKVVSPGFQKDGIAVSRIGIKMYVTIRELGVQVMFSGLIFSVEVPFSTFANNTEGQCGTCTNDVKDECRLPGGAVADSCSQMAGHWKVTDPGQQYCLGPPPAPTSVAPTRQPTPCPSSSICQLILSSVFEACHAIIPPLPFYMGCVFDHCHITDLEVVCSSLELYATLCAAQGVCIDWRGQTNNSCPFVCPAGKVYRACGKPDPPYCHGKDSTSFLALPEAGPITEGCFCPDSMMLFSTDVPVCVPADCRRCQGLHGEPVELGRTISADCQECTCEESTLTMSCRRQPCPMPPACPTAGFVPVPVALKPGQCCPEYHCVCNRSYCPETLDCPKGSHLTLTQEKGACCPSQKCSPTACNVNGTLYQPGAVVSSGPCETCRCEAPSSPESGSFMVNCETQMCDRDCPVGFEYQVPSGQCCGQCVQVNCSLNTSSSPARLLQPGESWSDPGNHCVTHKCERYQDGLVVVTTKKECPPLSCPRDQAQQSTDGCCLFCPPAWNESTCALRHRTQTIRQGGCSSGGPVRLSYCQGNCGNTTSMYSLEANAVEHTCKCCQELRTSQRNVTLHCADGSSRDFSYTQVEECGCAGQHCHSPQDASSSESPESESRQR